MDKRKRKSARAVVPPRPDMDRFRSKQPYGGREVLIFDTKAGAPVICRIQFAADIGRLTALYGADAVATAETITGGEIEISVEERDQIAAYVTYLESKVPPKLIGPRPLSNTQTRLIEIEAAAWAAGGSQDKRSPELYRPWSVIAGMLPNNLAVAQRTLNRWRTVPEYRAAFVRACAARLTARLDGKAKKSGHKITK